MDVKIICDVYTKSTAKRNKIDLDQKKYDFGVRRYDEISQIMTDYYNGKVNQQDIVRSFNDYCKKYLDFQTSNGIVQGNDTDKKNTIMRTYEDFQMHSSLSAVNVCFQKSDEIAKQYGYKGYETRDFVYYDADLYYSNQDLRSVLIGSVEDMFQNWDLENIHTNREIEKTETNTVYILGGISFNGIWSDRTKNGINLCNMIDLNEVPPKGFTFFYKESDDSSITDQNGAITLESQKGLIIINGTKMSYQIDVPFNNSLVLGKLNEFFNVGDLLLKSSMKDTNLLSFAKNFNIYSRFYYYKNYEF